MLQLTETPLVVCVDDEPAILAALERALRGEPYLVLVTQNPEEALRWTQEHEVSVLVADQRMPGMTGSDLLQAVHERSPRTSRIMLTGFPEDGAESLCSQGVIRTVLTKPWDDDALRDTLRDSVREAAPASRPPAEGRPRTNARKFREIPHVIDLNGKTVAEAMKLMMPLLRFARGVHSGLLILIRNLRSLQGSVTGLITELRRAAGSDGVPLCLVDASGLVQTLDEALGPAIAHFALGRPGRPKAVKRVLVVEDHEDTAGLLRTIIESEGHSCRVVGTAESALREVKPGSFDLVFVDLNLPNGDGLSVARGVAERAPGTEIILLSAALTSLSKAAFRRLGIRKCIPKPFRVKTILNALR